VVQAPVLGRQGTRRRRSAILWLCRRPRPSWPALPAPSGCASASEDAFQARRPTIAAGHFRADAAFVEKTKPAESSSLTSSYPDCRRQQFPAFLFLRPERFLYATILTVSAIARARGLPSRALLDWLLQFGRSNPAVALEPAATAAVLLGRHPARRIRAAFALAVPSAPSALAERGSSCRTDVKPLRELLQRPLAGFIRRQQFATQNIGAGLRHWLVLRKPPAQLCHRSMIWDMTAVKLREILRNRNSCRKGRLNKSTYTGFS
jgi:hypothetical protein